MTKLQGHVESSADNEEDKSTATSALGPTARVLFTPELVSLIFSFSQSVTLATPACVCKGWSDAALDQLWEHLSSVFPLVELVLDLDLIEAVGDLASLKVLNNALGNADWNRFHAYAKRVRSLEFNESATYRLDSDTPALDSAIIAVLCLHHPFGATFFPRLRRLCWVTDGSAVSVLPFLSSELKELYLDMSTVDASDVNGLFNAIIGRTPGLVTLQVEAIVSGTSVDAALARWLQTTPNLEEISLPRYYLTPTLVRAMGFLPRLKTLDQSFEPNHQGDQSDVVQCLPSDTFPGLLNLGLNTAPLAASRFLLASQEIGSRLSRIVLHAIQDLDTKDLLIFTTHIAENCSAMTELGLNLFIRPTPQRATEISPLPMALLESLYRCTRLKKLEIGHHFPFTFHQDDVERMGRAWPQMVYLEVCADPDFDSDQMGSSLSILTAFAKSLPNLELLGLYINQAEHLSFGGDLHPQWQFRRLKELYVGLSRVPKDRLRHVGFYIASLCWELPELTWSTTGWHSGFIPNNWYQTEAILKEVEDILGFAMEVKRAGRLRLRGTGTDTGIRG